MFNSISSKPSVALLVLLGAGGCKGASPTTPSAGATAEPSGPAALALGADTLAAFAPLPKVFESPRHARSEDKITLGRMLYYDERLSKNHDVSCNSCHLLDGYGVDGANVSTGHRGQTGDRNSPTVYNSGGHIAQFWDGRAADVEEQAKGPVLNPVEMAMPSPARVVQTLSSIPGYVEAFGKAFPGEDKPVTYDNMATAIGAFERGLVTPDRLDALLAGDQAALSDQEKRGLQAFVTHGCTVCHSGPAVGGRSMEKLGMVSAWPGVEDVGRFKVTNEASDRFVFRVPTLRNVAETGPYMHDGGVDDLGTMVEMMAKHQAGTSPSTQQVADIVAFLGALTGTVPTEYIAKPELPASGPSTPKPDPS